MLFNVHIGLVFMTGVFTIFRVNGYGGDCNFDNGWCGWKNNEHNCFNWTIDQGKTTDKTSGPISDHTTGSSNGSYAVIYGRRARLSDCKAVLQSPDIKRVQTHEVLFFWYHMNGNGIGNLSVYTVAEDIRQRIWHRQGRQGPDWLLATVPISTWSYRIEFEATARYPYGSDLAIDDISLHIASSSQRTTTVSSTQTTVPVTPLPIKCDFDDGMCGLLIDETNSTMVSWKRKKGPESFRNSVLISGDNTTGKGSYLSLIVNDKRAMIGDKAILYLPVVRNKKMACLTFAYNLPSITSGGIQIFQTDIWTKEAKLLRQVSGNHGTHWRSTYVRFYPSNDPYQVIIEGSYSGEPGYIVAIDDLNFVDGFCEGFVTTPTPTTPTTTPTTPSLPPMSVRETRSCQPMYSDLLNDISCDFTADFCKYLQVKSKWQWKRANKPTGWLGKVPERKNTEKSYYIVASSDYLVPRNSTAAIETGVITDEDICIEFWYSLPISSYIARIELQTTWGHTEPIWKKSSRVSDGKWTKQSLIIRYHGTYKIIFWIKKTSSSSRMGLDDIRVYKPHTQTTELMTTTKYSSVSTAKRATPTSMSYEAQETTENMGIIGNITTQPSTRKVYESSKSSAPTHRLSTVAVKTSQIVTSETMLIPTTEQSMIPTEVTPQITRTTSMNPSFVTSEASKSTHAEYSTLSTGISNQSKIPSVTKSKKTNSPVSQITEKTKQVTKHPPTKQLVTTRNTSSTTTKVTKFPSTPEKSKTTPGNKKTTKSNTKKPKITKPFKTPQITRTTSMNPSFVTSEASKSTHAEYSTLSTGISNQSKIPSVTKSKKTNSPVSQITEKTKQVTKHPPTSKTTPGNKKTTKSNTKKPKITKPFKTEEPAIKVTEKTKSVTKPPPIITAMATKKRTITMTEKSKSGHLSPGAQAGIGISVSLLGVGVVAALLFIMKHKLTKSAVLVKDDKIENNVGMVTLSVTYNK